MSSLAQSVATALQNHYEGRIPETATDTSVDLTIEDHPGAFDADEIMRLSRQFPAAFVSLVGIGASEQKGRQEPCRFVVNVFVQGPGERRHSAHVTRGDLAEAIVLGIKQALADPHLFVGVDDLDGMDGDDVAFPAYRISSSFGRPRSIVATNLYSGDVDDDGIAWWSVQFEVPFEPEGTLTGSLEAWDLYHVEFKKADWREGVVTDADDDTLTHEKDMSP